MLANEQEPTESCGEPTETSASFNRIGSAILFVLALILMCICEAEVINGLWFGAAFHMSTAKRLLTPLSILLPGFFSFVIRLVVKKQSKDGEISLRAASILNNLLGALVVFTYIAISHLVDVAFP